MGLNGTFNNISVILLRSILFVEETGGPGENPHTGCIKVSPDFVSIVVQKKLRSL
jgi:hypothetical protein